MNIPRKSNKQESISPILPNRPITDARIQATVDFMRQHLDQAITVPRLAKNAELSASYFTHVFKENTGLPPVEYLKRLRMQKARDLLTGSRLRIKEVMAAAGYNNKTHFGRDFRRYFDTTPSEFQKRSQP